MMIVLGYWLPGIEKVIPLEQISTIGIAGIFFFYGLKLSPEQLKKGLCNWKLHMLVQSSTFLIFPAMALSVYPFIYTQEYMTLWLAVFFFASLPSTVSSSVVMVSIAKGNIPGAIFNASISGLIGIIATPIWMGLFLEAGGEGNFKFGHILLQLIIKILLPVVLGLILHRFWGDFAKQHKEKLNIFDKTVILIIVFKSFSHSFSSGIFKGISALELCVVGLGVIALFFIVYYLIMFMSNLLNFNQEDRITALFCGSKKSLMHGTVFSNVLFAGMSTAGIFLVPIMIYHAFQLVIISIFAQNYASKSK
jgi:sodium/bile acid cotransporter 7